MPTFPPAVPFDATARPSIFNNASSKKGAILAEHRDVSISALEFRSGLTGGAGGRPYGREVGRPLYGEGGKFKELRVGSPNARRCRSSLSFPSSPRGLLLCFHAHHCFAARIKSNFEIQSDPTVPDGGTRSACSTPVADCSPPVLPISNSSANSSRPSRTTNVPRTSRN